MSDNGWFGDYEILDLCILEEGEGKNIIKVVAAV
jgi:hypothetical protein